MIFGGCVLSERELAFIAIHKDSYPRVYSFVRRQVESAELAEELAADVFRVVWQKWDKETRTDIAWLLTVARNLIGKAGALDCSEGAAKVRLHRARAAFRKQMSSSAETMTQKMGA